MCAHLVEQADFWPQSRRAPKMTCMLSAAVSRPLNDEAHQGDSTRKRLGSWLQLLEARVGTAGAWGAIRMPASEASGTEGVPGLRSPEDLQHLQWLSARDQQVLCRAECAAALREEAKLLSEIQAAISGHERAIEHCRAASETDPDWFNLDVQDCHSRRALILKDALHALQASTAPAPKDAAITDGIRGRIYSSYAHTAQATSRVTLELQEQEAVQRLAEHGQAAAVSARAAFGTLSSRISGLSARGPQPAAPSSECLPEGVAGLPQFSGSEPPAAEAA